MMYRRIRSGIGGCKAEYQRDVVDRGRGLVEDYSEENPHSSVNRVLDGCHRQMIFIQNA